MKKSILKLIRGLVLTFALVAGISAVISPITTSNVSAVTYSLKEGADSAKGTDQQTDLFGDKGVFTTITNVLLFIIGAVSVIMLIYGGIRYVISAGDSNAVTAAKNTILYAIVGVVISILAYALVNFVITSFSASA